MSTFHATAACGECGEPAVYLLAGSRRTLCALCGAYEAGTEHGRAAYALEQLSGAAHALTDAGLDVPEIVGIVDTELRVGAERDAIVPEYATGPRPFRFLLLPLDHGADS